ncbi:hypothetical protein Tco_0211249 [Tanacetum coccineum]
MTNIQNWKSKFIFMKETLISDAYPALITDFHHGLGTFAFSYPTELIALRAILSKPRLSQNLSCILLGGYDFESVALMFYVFPSFAILLFLSFSFSDVFRNFMKRPGQTSTFSMRSVDQPVDVGSPFVDHLKVIDDNDQGESSSISKNRDIVRLELAVVGDSPFDQGAGAAEGSRKRHLIIAALEEADCFEYNILVFLSYLNVQEAYYAHNVLSVLHCPSLKRKLDSMSHDNLVNVYDIYALHLGVNVLLEHEMSELKDSHSKAQKNQDVEGSQVVKDLRLRPSVKEVERLGQRCQDLEVEKESLLSKESQALDKVHGLGSSWDFKDVGDYNPDAEKINDEAAEAFYKLEFPYTSLLVEKAGQSLRLLADVDPPTI